MSNVTSLKPKLQATHDAFKLIENIHGYTNLYKVDDEGEKLVSGQIQALGQARDTDSSGWCVYLQFANQDSQTVKLLMPCALFAGDKTEVIRQLLDKGLFIARKSDLFDYLQHAGKERYTTVSSTGWHGDTFVLPDRITGNQKYLLSNPEPTPPPQGTLESWRNEVSSRCVGNSRLIMGMCAAFAGPLLEPTGTESGGIHIVGSSSAGKTKTLAVASSVFGTDISTWRSTINGLEGKAARHCDGCLLLDEIGQSESREAGAAAYLLANGQGKSRANRNGTERKIATWRLLFLSTGEATLSEQMAGAHIKSHAGQEVRIANVEADAGSGMGLFECIHDVDTPAQFADKLSELAAGHRGHAGHAFIDHFCNNRPSCLNRIEEVKQVFIDTLNISGESGQVQRVANRFALLAAAGELATDAGITGWSEGASIHALVTCFRVWRSNWAPEGSHEKERAIKQVQGFLQQHASRFESLPSDGTTPHNRAGYFNSGEYWIFPAVFTGEVCKGLRPSTVTDALINKDYLYVDSGSRRQARRQVSGKRQRFYVISESALSDENPS